ncbi:MAG TPA: 50S ribosomal protein L25/general stress protein Ctc [Rhizomicrobium sp.]
MSQIQELKVEAREGTGKGPAYQARLKGLIPGIVYGGGSQPQPVNVDTRTLERHAGNAGFLTTLLTLDIGGKKTQVIPRQVQLDPVSDRPVHVDFLRLEKGATVRLEIPVHFKGQGESPGLKKGGVLNIVSHTIELYCQAEKIPHVIEVDVAALDINDTIHISSLTLPEGVKPAIRGRDFTIASIVASTSVMEEQRAAAAAAAAPVVEVEAAPVATGAPGATPAAPAAGAAAAPGGKAPAAPAKK